ncbi:hypothetical protein BDF22DRAFT_743422 [Syncephalis plumigaleata]|nr:hypothetical protein BDF22DRAFT_743422 [Syncephalis plumigaleata]
MYSRTKPVGAQSSSSEYHRYNTNDYTTRQEEQTQAWLSPASHHTSRQVATTTIATADTRIETWPNGDESGAEDSFVAASYTSSVRDSVVDTASDIDISLSFGHNSSYNTDSFNIGNYSVVDNNYTVNSRGSFGQLLKSDAPSTIALSRESSVETLRGIIANKEHEACDTPDHWSSSPSWHAAYSITDAASSRGASSGSVGFTSPLEKTRAAGLATSSTPWSPSTASTAGLFTPHNPRGLTSDIVMAMNGTQATTYQNTRSPPLDAQPSSFNYKMTNDHHQHPQSQKAIDSIAVEYATMYSAPSDQLHEEQPLNRGNLHTEARVERATSPTPSPKSWHAHEYSRDDYNAVEMTTPHTPRHMEFNESNNPRASRRLTQMFQYAVGDEMRAKRMSLAAQMRPTR